MDIADNNVDDHVDREISTYLDLDNPKSFFLFAGAGSGKTRTLVKVLNDHLLANYAARLGVEGRKIAVITYTNAACDEIVRRTKSHPLVQVTTIHSFAWLIIKGFNEDIRDWLIKELSAQILDLEDKERRGRGGKASLDRQAKIASTHQRIEQLAQIAVFSYNPNANISGKDSLNHSEVIRIASDFLASKPTMKDIVASQYPVILIDESQDTNRHLVDALFSLKETHGNKVAIGFIGDTMQRIYADGKEHLGSNLDETWQQPQKVMNHRSAERIVALINAIRADADDKQQRWRTDNPQGCVRFFIAPRSLDKMATESAILNKMAEVTNNPRWENVDEVKMLALEHHMSARRLGFDRLFDSLRSDGRYADGLADGTLPFLRFYSEIILPLREAHIAGDEYTVASIVRKYCPQLLPANLRQAKNQTEVLLKIESAVIDLMSLWQDDEDPTFLAVIKKVHEHRLFPIPEELKPIATRDEAQYAIMEQAIADTGFVEEEDSPLKALNSFVETPFSQIVPYKKYIEGEARFDTHQGVKGLEFPRVLVIIDDEEAKGFMFKYDKLFGTQEKSQTDIKNENEGRDNAIDRTRRLFYVTCSRAEEDLAVLVYTDEMENLEQKMISSKWFEPEEVIVLREI